MNTKEIAATFRGAVKEGLLTAWSNPVPGAVWYVEPTDGETRQWDWKDAHDFAVLIQGAGIEPYYRTDEV